MHPTSSSPRIGYVVKMYPRFSETFVVTELLQLQSRGADLEIFSLRAPVDGRFHPMLAEVHGCVSYVPVLTRQADLWTLLGEAADELPIADRFAELVTEPAAEVFQAVGLARWVRQRGIDHLHAHFASVSASVTRLAARLAGITWSMTLHAKDIFHDEVDDTDLARKLAQADLSVTVSDYNLVHLRERFGDAATARLRRIHNGIDLTLFDHCPLDGRPATAPGIIGVGRLVEKKGFADLLAAVALLRDRGRPVPLELVGGGSEEAALRQRADELGLADLVTFRGPLTQAETRDAIRRASVMAAPCVVGEDGNRDGLPTVVLESLALGTPVVATPVTGMAEAVVDGHTGLLVGEHDVPALADAIATLLDDPVTASRFSHAGRRLVEQRFDTRVNAGLLHEAVLGVVDPAPSAPSAPASSAPATSAPTSETGSHRRHLTGGNPVPPVGAKGGGRSRVVYVSTDPGVPAFGTKGSSVHVQAMLTQLVERGHDVHLITARPGGDAPAALTDVVVHLVPRPVGGSAADREAELRNSDAAVGRILDRLAAEAPIALVYERYALWGRTATAWARNHRVRSVLEVNAPLPLEQQRHRELADPASALRVAREACGAATVVIAVSDEVNHWVRSLGVTTAVHTVPNGVDTRRFTPTPIRTGAGAFTVGFIGTLKPWHGVEVLIDALAASHAAEDGYRLLLVGDGPQRKPLSKHVKALGLGDRVEFTGAVDPTDVPALLARMDVAVAPYPELDDFYFSPLKIYEYLAAGVPVVASAIGGIPQLLRTGSPDTEIGAVCAAGSPHHLAAAIASLRHDPERRALLAARGRAAAVADHDWSAVVDRILTLLADGDTAELPKHSHPNPVPTGPVPVGGALIGVGADVD